MSDLHAGEWVALRPSSLKRRWQQVAACLTVLLAIAFFFKGALNFSALLVGAGLANGMAAAWLFFTSRSLEVLEGVPALRIDGTGLIWINSFSVACTPVFVSNQLVVLKAPQARWPIWCDALPADAFRRLVVAARWPRRTESFSNALPRV